MIEGDSHPASNTVYCPLTLLTYLSPRGTPTRLLTANKPHAPVTGWVYDHECIFCDLYSLCKPKSYTNPFNAITSTYDHRVWRTGLPVRSAVLKPHAGKLVVRWVTTSESLLLYVLTFFFIKRILRGAFRSKSHFIENLSGPRGREDGVAILS